MAGLNVTATLVFVFFFLLVTALGFWASRWRAGDLGQLHQWGLGGRQFGPFVTWFLLGGDLYTAYTVIAVPALAYTAGAIAFFAVPYTIFIYPYVYLTMPRLWAVARKRGYVTAADFVAGRYGDKALALGVALVGMVATMPYIALQLVGMERVIGALGFSGTGLMTHAPLTIAFLILAVYTYSSGLRAPAVIAFVKDAMIYVFVIAAVVIAPIKLGGYAHIFAEAGKSYGSHAATAPLLAGPAIWPYVTLAIGSTFALFLYPHAMTGVLAANSGRTIRRNAMTLPAYSVALGLIALMGFMAHAAGVKVANPQDAVPQLILTLFPDWFAGFCFAAIAVGALVPAAVMSIGAANTFTRNVWKPFVDPTISGEKEASLAKLVSLIVKVGALAVILFVPTQFAINLQLLGGVWMAQAFPAVILGLYTRWFSGRGLLAGLVAGVGVGTWLSYVPASGTWVPVHAFFGHGIYNGLTGFVLNMVVAVVISAVLPNDAPDETAPADYLDEAPATPATA
ncbi:MAG: sodium:solute symporter [Hyphomicrobiales bacterium]|nr:sodium:solute symporter [Hyphomicrobiales bacterium]MDE2018067.1 sodium:solute symporter [Hyphomicrobiales bacterium]